MNLINVLTWVTLGCLPAFLLLDVVYRARQFETPQLWRVRAFIVTVFIFALAFVVPLFWTKLLGGRTLVNLAPLGMWIGAAAGIVIYEFLHYWYHRVIHRYDALFRWIHQMHHSVEGIDAWGAYFISPLDAFLFASIANIVFVPLLGLSAEAAVLANLFLTFNAVFQHANIRTPRWLGFIIQRPESHGVHHERGLHAFNYCDLPLWDIAFGTFRNPISFERECGYYDGASSRIGEMLIGRDVTAPPAGSVEERLLSRTPGSYSASYST